jgi:type II secretory pathway pseudopilin PulG
MAHMINRYALIVVIILSATVLAVGCSSITEDPKEKANEAVASANGSIQKHNKLFQDARDTYADVKKKIESSKDPSKEKTRISEAQDTMQDARGHLQEARSSMQEVQNLDVDPAIKKYAGTLTTAMDDQLAAEAREIEFYGVLEEDPALKDERKKATDLLSEVGDGYEKAEKSYAKAQKLADSRPKLIQVPGEPKKDAQS